MLSFWMMPAMAQFKHLGNYLREARVDSGLMQINLARILKYSSSQFISNWERGLSAPPNKDLQVLIKLLKLNRAKLVEVMVEDATAEVLRKVYLKRKQNRQ
jgi:transcriptional regulator with XRE-family HTH domain